MNELFVPYEIAVKLKEIGFDEPCFAGYQDNGMGQVELFYKSSNQTGASLKANVYGKYCHQNNHVVKAPLYQQAIKFLTNEVYPNLEFEYSNFKLPINQLFDKLDEYLNDIVNKRLNHL